MAKLIITTHCWGAKYSPSYVARLADGVRRHLRQPHHFIVITDDVMGTGVESMIGRSVHAAWSISSLDVPLLEIPGCFVRLRLFDPTWQAMHGLSHGDRIVSIDLDSIITGPLDPLFDRADNFSILTGANKGNPCPYNGSIWMLRAGYRPDVWSDFSLEATSLVPHYEFPDDQAWLAHKIPGVVGWRAGAPSGVYAFKKRGWPKNSTSLPSDARLVVFPGRRDPSQFTHLDWVRDKWAA